MEQQQQQQQQQQEEGEGEGEGEQAVSMPTFAEVRCQSGHSAQCQLLGRDPPLAVSRGCADVSTLARSVCGVLICTCLCSALSGCPRAPGTAGSEQQQHGPWEHGGERQQLGGARYGAHTPVACRRRAAG